MGSEAGREEDDVAALRGKPDDAERRLHYTALELRAALDKIRAWGQGSSSSPPRDALARARLVLAATRARRMEHVGSSFWRSFVLAYMGRAGVAVTSRGLGLLRSGIRATCWFEKLLGERHMHYREDAVRLGMFLARSRAGTISCDANCAIERVLPERAARCWGRSGSELGVSQKVKRGWALISWRGWPSPGTPVRRTSNASTSGVATGAWRCPPLRALLRAGDVRVRYATGDVISGF